MSEILKDIRDKYPERYELFETPIHESFVREVMENDVIDESVQYLLSEQEGFPYKVDPSDVSYSMVFVNSRYTDSFVEMYLFDVIDEDNDYFYLKGEKKEEALATVVNQFFNQDMINKFRVEHMDDLNVNFEVHTELTEFLETHAWYDENYLSSRMAELYDEFIVRSMIVNRRLLASYGYDYFMDKFAQASQEYASTYGVPQELLDVDETPIKVIELKLDADFDTLAETFAERLYNYESVQDYMTTGFYYDMFGQDYFYYRLEIDADPEDYLNE